MAIDLVDGGVALSFMPTRQRVGFGLISSELFLHCVGKSGRPSLRWRAIHGDSSHACRQNQRNDDGRVSDDWFL